ncbi:GDSL-type esterase/lipase family protein [Bacteroides sp.]
MKNELKSFLLAAVCSLGLASTYAQAPTVHTIGDSTMEEKSTDPSVNTNGQRGWPQMLPQFMVNGAKLNNRAKSGTSSKTFYEESRFWTTVKPQIKEGDYVIIQFGHNDEKHGGADGEIGTYPWTTYQEYLRKYVNEVRALNATPILFTPIVRGYFSGNKITDKGAHNLGADVVMSSGKELDYVAAMKEVAKELNCLLVDHTALTREICDEYGEEKAKELIYNVGDGTHIGEYGATLYARLAVQGLIAEGLLTEYFNADPDVLINPTTHDFGKSYLNAGSVYAFSISGIDLTPGTGKVTVSASEGFKVSLNASGEFASTAEVEYQNGNLPMTSVYVKFLPTEKGVKNGTLTVSNGTSTKTATLTGEGVSFEGGVAAQAYWQLSQDTKAVVTGPILAAEEVFSQMYADRYAKPGNPTTWADGLVDPETKTQRNIIEGDDWPANEIDVNYNRYIEFSVTANANTTFNIDSIGLYAGGSGGNGMCFRVMCSKDPGFGEYTLISNRPTNVSNTMYPISLKEIIELKGEETLYLRVYPWYNASSNRKSICLYGVTVKGVVTEGDATSIHSVKDIEKAYCTPVITTDRTTLYYELSEQAPVNITLYDMNGRTMLNHNKSLEPGSYTQEIDLEGFSNGIYLCKLTTGTLMQTMRIIKK